MVLELLGHHLHAVDPLVQRVATIVVVAIQLVATLTIVEGQVRGGITAALLSLVD